MGRDPVPPGGRAEAFSQQGNEHNDVGSSLTPGVVAPRLEKGGTRVCEVSGLASVNFLFPEKII